MSNPKISVSITPDGIYGAYGKQPIAISPEHPNYKAIADACAANDGDALFMAMAVAGSPEHKVVETAIATAAQAEVIRQNNRFTVVNDILNFDGSPVHDDAAKRVHGLAIAGFSVDPMVHFLERKQHNTSFHALNELYAFLVAHNLPLTTDGCFLAFKVVRENYRDKHSGTIDNTPGVPIPRLERNQVDDNWRIACSSGYHVGAVAYYKRFYNEYIGNNDRILIVKVDPADVISVPSRETDKMRVCWYEVVAEIGNGDVTAVHALDKSPIYLGIDGEIRPELSPGKPIVVPTPRPAPATPDTTDLGLDLAPGEVAYRYLVTTCPQCSANFRTPEAIRVVLVMVGQSFPVFTGLDANGVLNDLDGDPIAKGFFSAATCASCNLLLDRWQQKHTDGGLIAGPASLADVDLSGSPLAAASTTSDDDEAHDAAVDAAENLAMNGGDFDADDEDDLEIDDLDDDEDDEDLDDDDEDLDDEDADEDDDDLEDDEDDDLDLEEDDDLDLEDDDDLDDEDDDEDLDDEADEEEPAAIDDDLDEDAPTFVATGDAAPVVLPEDPEALADPTPSKPVIVPFVCRVVVLGSANRDWHIGLSGAWNRVADDGIFNFRGNNAILNRHTVIVGGPHRHAINSALVADRGFVITAVLDQRLPKPVYIARTTAGPAFQDAGILIGIGDEIRGVDEWLAEMDKTGLFLGLRQRALAELLGGAEHIHDYRRIVVALDDPSNEE